MRAVERFVKQNMRVPGSKCRSGKNLDDPNVCTQDRKSQGTRLWVKVNV